MLMRFATVFVLLMLPAAAHAQRERVVVAKSISPAATFAARSAGSTKFEVLPANANLYTGDLLVTLPDATLESKDSGVLIHSLADYDGRSPLPILETALILGNAEKGVDLAFTLDRGRVDITNKKASGAAVVSVQFWGQNWIITLDDPGARVAVEFCGRWPAGSKFTPVDPKTDAKPEAPMASLVLLVLNGSAKVTSGDTTIAMEAPPGPAVLEWDSIVGAMPRPQKLGMLPNWADPTANLSERGKKFATTIEKFRLARSEKPAETLKQFLDSKDPIEQHVALVSAGALDELELLGQSLVAAKTLEEWDVGIRVLRHWLGRAPGQDQKLYQFLITVRGYTKAQARNVMKLLFGFSPAELRKPETYQVLIDYLGHEKPGIRNLAAWHLVRLVPQGKTIPFKPDGPLAAAKEAQVAWKKLIPAGALPPAAPKK